MFLLLASALVASSATPVASLRLQIAGDAEASVQIWQDSQAGYKLTADCITACKTPFHVEIPISDSPLGLLDLDEGGLLYSIWGTGCCYVARVWKITPNGINLLLEAPSRSRPSVLMGKEIEIDTYMRPQDTKGRDLSMSLRTVRWVYRSGSFKRLKKHVASDNVR